MTVDAAWRHTVKSDLSRLFPQRDQRDRRLGESAQEVAAVGGPDEALGDDRVALVVDLEASAFHEPRPGALDDPAFGKHLEAIWVDAVDDLDARRDGVRQCSMKVRLKPQSHHSLAKRAERSRARSATVMPPTLSEMLAATTTTAMRSPRVSTIPKVLRPLIFFPASNPSVFLLTVAAGTYRACIDDARRGLALTTLLLAHRRGQSLGDPLPGAVCATTRGGSGAPSSSSDSSRAAPATDNPSPSRRRWRRPPGGGRP